MKAIFLDFDGVLNSFETLSRGVHVDQEKVILIDKLCRHIDDDVFVVISSTWRIINTRVELTKILRSSGLRANVKYDVTPNHHGGMRGAEIEDWLHNHPEVDGYVIIDDDSDFFGYQKPFHVKTSMDTGFTDEHLKQAKDIFDTLNLC